jgi:hypothetical protein
MSTLAFKQLLRVYLGYSLGTMLFSVVLFCIDTAVSGIVYHSTFEATCVIVAIFAWVVFCAPWSIAVFVAELLSDKILLWISGIAATISVPASIAMIGFLT